MADLGIAKGYRAPGRTLARLSLPPDLTLIPSAAGVVAAIASPRGLDGEALDTMQLAVRAMLTNAISHSPDETSTVDLILEERGSALVIAVEDRGSPFDYEDLESGLTPGIRPFIDHGGEDEVHFINLGRQGNRVEIVHYLGRTDVRKSLPRKESQPEPETVAEGSEVSMRLLGPADARSLARAIWRCYGYSYPCDFIYSPEEVIHRMEEGRFISAGAFDSSGDLVGHLALSLESDSARVAESGQAVVDPRWRGHRVFENLKQYLRQNAIERGLIGLYSEAVTRHQYSQKGNLKLGAHEIGFLLAYSPGNVRFRSIETGPGQQRQSVALMYLPIGEHPHQQVHLPTRYHAVAKGIYQRLGIDRDVTADSQLPVQQTGNFDVTLRLDHQQAIFNVAEPGKDSARTISGRLGHIDAQGVKVTYVDLPLAAAGSAAVSEELTEYGFFFGALIPCLGTSDVFRMQRLAGVEIDREGIQTASDAGREMLAAVFDEWQGTPQA